MKQLTRFLLSIALSIALTAPVGCGKGKGGSDRSQSSDSSDREAAPTLFSLSGTVTATQFSRVDSDTNDSRAPSASNNDGEYAQLPGNPSVLGGFVSAEGSGVSGQRYASDADPEDWFSIAATPGQSADLRIHKFDDGNPAAVDLDLYLYAADDTANPIASSTGTSARESIAIPANGEFLLRVVAEAGISNYTLKLDAHNSAAGSPSVGETFVPGELLIKWKSRPSAHWLEARGLEALGEATTGKASAYRLRRTDLAPINSGMEFRHLTASAPLRRKLHTLAAVKNLQAAALIEWAEPNYVYRHQVTPNDENNYLQWHYRQIRLPQAWDITTGSGDVIVAVLDSGVFSGHPELRGKLVSGYDFISDVESAGDGDGMDANPEDPGDGSQQDRSSWHGTHVSGTVGALTDNGAGVSGAGWQTRIMPLRVIGKSGGSSADVAQAVRFAAGLSNDSGTLPARRADIINMSFGGDGHSQTLQSAIDDARAAGVVVVAAAGNGSAEAEFYPAAMRGVLAVSATDYNQNKTPYSNFGSWVDLAAPGGNMSMDANGDGYGDGVLSTHVEEGSSLSATYRFLQGTSMASPHVAAVIALMKSVNNQLTPQQLDALLAQGKLTTDIGASGKDKLFGMGLIDAYKAVRAASGAATVPVLAAEPESLNFGAIHTALEVDVKNIGAEGARISGDPVATENWISAVRPVQTDDNGLGRYRISVKRENLADGTYSGSIRFPVEGASDLLLRANIQVGRADTGADAGYLYILLLAPGQDSDGDGTPDDRDGDGFADLEVVAQQAMTATGGKYEFEFSAVPPGKYLIAAGADVDGDGTICGPGEACSIFPASGLSAPLNPRDNVSGLDFPVGYDSDTGGGQKHTTTQAATGRPGPIRLRVTAGEFKDAR
ncbi:S8 family peptidase [Microbulbifer magnicolonia]|uniref:S8 family peptidase n=1 Tax=Microbulbifer magnicolonia TaxID=3109744 RepID=UPI002B400D4A|nr:S8 family peptidase [Microbulbifer sp. GG15]